eukprot:236624_1
MLSNKMHYAQLPSVRIVVLGDSCVGKTSLISRITQDKLPSNLRHSAPGVEVMMHICGHKSYFVEFIDISGLIVNQMSRSIYYKRVDGIVLMFDTNNKKSYSNLKHWLREYHACSTLKHDSANTKPKFKTRFVFPEIIVGGSNGKSKSDSSIPIFIIGNKTDLHSEYKINHMLSSEFNCEKDFGYDYTFMSALTVLKHQRAAMTQFKRYLKCVITKIEMLKNKHLVQSQTVETVISDHTNFTPPNKSSIKSLKSKLFSFW